MSTTCRRAAPLQAAIGLLLFVALTLGSGSQAQAKSTVHAFSVRPTDAGATQAGGHPNTTIEYKVGNHLSDPTGNPCQCNDPKVITQDLPTGFIGNPHATPQCTTASLAQAKCPIDAQVGIVAIAVGIGEAPQGVWQFFPLYNMVPNSDQAGLLAFRAGEGLGPVYTELSARTGSDYGLRAVTAGLSRFVPPATVTIYLWGVPADPTHNPLRFGFGGQGGLHFCILGTTLHDPRPYLARDEFPPRGICETEFSIPHPSTSPLTPFLSSPTVCSGPLTSFLQTLAFDSEKDFGQSTYPAITGCDQLSFNPSLSAKPTTTETDAASGLDIHLSVPQFVSATTPSPSQIKASTVTLPLGFSINPSASNGKVTCSDADARFGTEAAAQCPDFSKIGTVAIDSSALPAPIPGYLYLGDPLPGERYRVILTADGFATHIKLAGKATPDQQTGQLTFSFPNLPQSPLTSFDLHVFGSERGILATPTQCGTYAVHSTFTPWDDALAEEEATQFFTLDQGPKGAACPTQPRGFSPSFTAAAAGNTGGAHTPFGLELTRADGEQNLSGIQVKTPPGFTATLKGIPYCPESAIAQLQPGYGYSGVAEMASPSCPVASQVGTTTAGVGAGTKPLYVSGKVFLAGPYKGAPLSLLAVVPAVSGPYDLGNVAVRVALRVDPVTAQVTAIADPLPLILEGILLRVRSVQIDLNRPDFILNPTSCDRSAVDARIEGDEGTEVDRSSPFQVANCATLPYRPGLGIRLSGGLNRRGHPAIHADVTSKPGEANLKQVVVTLPKGELLDNSHIGTVCTRIAFAQDACPPGALVGRVEVTSPLLDDPLTGSVYLRSSQHKLPDLALDLEGQFDIEAVGQIDSVKGRFRTTFDAIPDVPVSRISFDLVGGSKGLLQNSESLCGARKVAMVKMTGQNGATTRQRTPLKMSCGQQSGKAR